MRLGRLVLLGALLVSAGACDTFFTIDATVVACDSMLSLENVAATLHLDDGFGEEDHHATTAADGKLHMGMNEPDDVTATLTLTKATYQDWSHQYKGHPGRPATICLSPVAP